MIFLYVFCSSVNLFDWLQNHLIPCPFKAITGIDCPGCGFQRAFMFLIRGEFQKSWSLYPPALPLIALFVAAVIFAKFPFKYRSIVLKALAMLTGNFILLCYICKIFMR